MYHLSGCDRLIALRDETWLIVEMIAEFVEKSPQEVLQMAASQFAGDLFDEHGADAGFELWKRLIVWSEGICGAPINAVSDPRLHLSERPATSGE